MDEQAIFNWLVILCLILFFILFKLHELRDHKRKGSEAVEASA